MKRLGVFLLLLGLLSTPGPAGAELSAPGGVKATEGKYSDAIRITWHEVAGATRYEVWRDSYTWCNTYPCEPQLVLWEITGGLVHLDSVDILPFGEVFAYRVKACAKSGIDDQYICSDFSLPAYGYVSEDSPLWVDTLDFWGSGCFIATAAYGSYWDPHVMTLRRFRDSYLLTNALGTRLVAAYYKYSPPVAGFIAGHDRLRSVARLGLAPLVGFSWLAINCGLMSAWLIVLCLGALGAGASCLVVGRLKLKR